jgi:hypothetical protein
LKLKFLTIFYYNLLDMPSVKNFYILFFLKMPFFYLNACTICNVCFQHFKASKPKIVQNSFILHLPHRKCLATELCVLRPSAVQRAFDLTATTRRGQQQQRPEGRCC